MDSFQRAVVEEYIDIHRVYEAARARMKRDGPAILAAARQAAQLGKRDFAEHLGISRSYVQMVETGRYVMTPEVAAKLLNSSQEGP